MVAVDGDDGAVTLLAPVAAPERHAPAGPCGGGGGGDSAVNYRYEKGAGGRSDGAINILRITDTSEPPGSSGWQVGFLRDALPPPPWSLQSVNLPAALPPPPLTVVIVRLCVDASVLDDILIRVVHQTTAAAGGGGIKRTERDKQGFRGVRVVSPVWDLGIRA